MRAILKAVIWLPVCAMILALSSESVQACATCFGQTDSPLGRGLNWGIMTLLVVVNGVVGGICSFFVFVARRSAKLEAEDRQKSAAADAAHATDPSNKTI